MHWLYMTKADRAVYMVLLQGLQLKHIEKWRNKIAKDYVYKGKRKASSYVDVNGKFAWYMISGQIFYSRDSGDHWALLTDYLPPIYSIETAVID